MRRLLVSLVLLMALAASCGGGSGGGCTVTFGSGADAAWLRVEVADTPEERARGLMGRTTLETRGGMLFRFPGPTRDGFWMKDTSIPLSIVFVDGRSEVVDVIDMQPCTSGPCRVYRPSRPFVMSVEANQGWFQQNGVEIGDRVEAMMPGCA